MKATVAKSGVILAVLALANACTSTAEEPETKSRDGDVVIGEAEELLPGETLEDWRTYADHVVRVRVDSEKRGRLTPEEMKNGEGFVDRTLSFSVEQVLWSSPHAAAPPSRLTLQLDGWAVKGDRDLPVRFEGEPMIEVGNEYVMPIVRLTPGRQVAIPQWSNLSVRAILPISGEVIGRGDALVGGDPSRSPAAGRLWGRRVASVASELAVTRLPQKAAPYMQLAPTDRLNAIVQEESHVAPAR